MGEKEVQEEIEEDAFNGRPPYHSMTCATCLHLVEDNVCIALPPMPVLTSMASQKENQQLIGLSGGKVGQSTMSMKYTAVYPKIVNPNGFRACSLYIMDLPKVKKIEAEIGDTDSAILI